MIDLAEELQGAAPRPTRGFDADAVRRQARRRTHRQRLVASAAVALAIVLVAGGAAAIAGRGSTPASVQVGGHPDPLAGAAPRSWVRLLGRVPVPAPGQPSQITLTDLAGARERTGERPLPLDASQDAWAGHLRAVHLEALVVEPAVAPGDLRAELGFNQTQFDQVISWFEDGDHYIAVGRFDPAAIDAAVAADPVWGPQAEATNYRGVRYYRWGKDRALSRTTSPARPVGQGGRLVVGDGWIAWADSDAAAEATIDAFLDPTRSLAAVPSLRDAARAADEAQATQVVLLPNGQRPTAALRRPGTAEPPPIDTPVTLTGSTRRDGAEVIDQMAIGYASEDQAHANLAAVETTWQAVAMGFRLEVAQRGTVLVATVHHPPDQEIPGATVDGKVQQNLDLLNFSSFFTVRGTAPGPDRPPPSVAPATATTAVTATTGSPAETGLAPVTRHDPTHSFTVVTYHGIAFDVPAGWPVIDLGAERLETGVHANPGSCGRDLFTTPGVLTGSSQWTPSCPAPSADPQPADGLWIYAPAEANGLQGPQWWVRINGIDVAYQRTQTGAPAMELAFTAPDGTPLRALIGIGADPTVSADILQSLRPVRDAALAPRVALRGTLRFSGGPVGGNEEPVAGTVDARPLDTTGPTFSASTDEAGRFTFELPAGTYELTGRSPRYNGGDRACHTDSAIVVPTQDDQPVEVSCVMR